MLKQQLFKTAVQAHTTLLSIEGSKQVTGTQDLIKDINSTLLIAAPLLGGAAIGICALKKLGADEQEAVSLNNRMKMIAVAAIIVMVGAIIVEIITDYYK